MQDPKAGNSEPRGQTPLWPENSIQTWEKLCKNFLVGKEGPLDLMPSVQTTDKGPDWGGIPQVACNHSCHSLISVEALPEQGPLGAVNVCPQAVCMLGGRGEWFDSVWLHRLLLYPAQH